MNLLRQRIWDKFENLISKHDMQTQETMDVKLETAAEAFFRAYYLEQACSVQLKILLWV